MNPLANLPADAPTVADGRYTVSGRLGQGGMAGVYQVYDHKLGVWRAIKVLLPEYARRRKIRKRFSLEARTMARLEHPNLVRVYDVHDTGTLPYIVMELVKGGTLEQWTRVHGAMPARLAVRVTRQLVAGVIAAHDEGIVHRDIKPQNVLISRDGTCKLTDFGIAQADNSGMTRTGSVMGTLGYMAPEQRNDAKAVDARADLYSVGATLWHLFTTEPAADLFLAADHPQVLARVPPLLRPVLKKCLAYSRDDRYPDARALDAALAGVEGGLPEDPPTTPPLKLELNETPGPAPETRRSTADSEDDEDDDGPAFHEIALLFDGQDDPLGAVVDTTDERSTTEALTATPGLLPYTMPPRPTDTRRRTSNDETEGDSESDDSLPEWIDRDSLDGKHDPVDIVVQPTPAPAPQAPPPVPRFPPVADEEPPNRLLTLVLPAVIGLLAVAVFCVVGMVWFSRSATAVQAATERAYTSRASLYEVLLQEQPVVEALGRRSAEARPLADRYLDWTAERREPARSDGALALVDELERRHDETRGGGSQAGLDPAAAAIGRLQAARDRYRADLSTWGMVAAGSGGRLVIALGAGEAPPRDRQSASTE